MNQSSSINFEQPYGEKKNNINEKKSDFNILMPNENLVSVPNDQSNVDFIQSDDDSKQATPTLSNTQLVPQANKINKLGRQATKSFDGGKNKKLLGIQQAAKSLKFKRKLTSILGASELNSSKSGIKGGPKKKSSLFGRKFEIKNSFSKEQEESYLQNSAETNISNALKGSLANFMQSEEEENLRAVFIEQYGVTIEFPVYYFHQTTFVPHITDMVVTLGYHIIPKGPNTSIQNTYLDGTVEDQTYEEVYGEISGLLLTLQKSDGRNGFTQLRQIQIKNTKEPYIEFSRTGNYMGMIERGDARFHSPNVIKIFDSRDIHQCIDDIENGRSLHQIEIELEDFGSPKYFKFDANDRYFAISSKIAVTIIDLEEGKSIYQYKIDNEKYSGIQNIMINSYEGNNPYKQEGSKPVTARSYYYRCQIACKLIGLNTIEIFNILDSQESKHMSYFKKGKELVVQISDDFKQVCLSNGVEHYIHNGIHQQIIPSIKDKFIRNMTNDDQDFYLFTTKDYDRDIDILNTNNYDFNASIPRSSTPGTLKVHDSIIVKENGQKLLKYLICLDDKLYLDTIDLERGLDKDDEMEGFAGSCVQQYYSAFGFNWPYFSYATRRNFIIILNAFNPNFVQRYQMPKNTSKAVATFLADSHDLYIVLETIDQYFEVYQIDLDSSDPKLLGPIVKYSFDEVGDKPLLAFHARSSSAKDKINLNKILIIYMMHGTTLYSKACRDGTSLVKIDDDARNLYYQSDDEIFYQKTVMQRVQLRENKHREVEHSTIFQLQVLFGSTKQTAIYVDKDPAAEILNFGVDNTRRRLIILSGIKNHEEKRDKFITLFDFTNENILFNIRVTNREIIGRLKSNLYNFVEGHIYYENKVIKIRYDQIDKNGVKDLKQDQIFDYYDNILSLGQSNNTIQMGTPLQTTMYNRLAYLISNQSQLKPRKILILPYLHERKIILNRRVTANQFYTIFEMDGTRYILCMCISDNKMYVYTETGILVDRVLYRDIAEKCGKPDSMSEDAKYYIFRKSPHSIEAYLVQITLDGLKEQAQFNLKEMIEKNMNKLDQTLQTTKNLWQFWEDYLVSLTKPKNVKIDFQLNDNGDVLISIKPNKGQFDRVNDQKSGGDMLSTMFGNNQKNQSNKNKEINSIFFYICNSQEDENYGQYIYYDGNEKQQRKYKGVSMNQKYIFFWNLGKIWKLSLETKEIQRISLYISEEETETFIKNVRCGSNENIVSIIVRQNPSLDCIIIWDITKDLQTASFDVDNNALFFQDKHGLPYIAQKDYIINCSQDCKLKAYNMQIKDFDIENADFGFSTGHRVETESHNFMIFRNFINMSFSYMSFVIKENFDQSGYVRDDFLFDLEGYDYIINKKNLFFEDKGTLVTQEYEKLRFILKNYEKIDPVLLETLHYKNLDDEIPLHLALNANNNMMVNLILQFMSKIEFSAVGHIKNIFKDLISFHNFIGYLEVSPFQTLQMIQKQTIKIREEANDEEIIKIASSASSYVDGDYFKQAMQEDKDDPDCHIYATSVACIQADWILNEAEGHGEEFLKELLRLQNKQIFMTPYVKIIIRFLYEQYRNSTIKYLLPSFVIQFFLVVFYIIWEDTHNNEHFGLDDAADSEEKFDIWKTLMLIANLIITLNNMFIFTRQALKMKLLFFKRGWTTIEFTIIVSNLLICSSLFISYDRVTTRYFEVFCIVPMMIKSLYFFRLFGEIAPLIDIIFVIFNDIFYFMIIYCVALIAFIIAFYLMGQNQIEMELQAWKEAGAIEQDKPEPTQYYTLLGAVMHVYLSSLGEFDADDYTRSGGLVQNFLLMLFFFLSFFMCIHMLNMLIAIMGNSFEKNNQEKEARKNISQLQFVVENWWIDPIKNKDKIVYIIAASHPDHGHDNEDIDKVLDKVDTLINNQQVVMEQLKSIISFQKQGIHR